MCARARVCVCGVGAGGEGVGSGTCVSTGISGDTPEGDREQVWQLPTEELFKKQINISSCHLGRFTR